MIYYLKKRSLISVVLMVFLSLQAFGQKVTVNVKNTPISSVLSMIQKDYGFSFVVKSNDLDLSKVVSLSAKNQNLVDIIEEMFGLTKQNVDVEMDGKTLSISKRSITTSFTQNQNIVKGIVLDRKTGQTIIGASIFQKGTANGVITDLDGRFEITVPEGQTLVCSSIGFLPSEVVAGKNTNITISLDQDVELLDEVVVIGYGSVKKSDLTGAVSTVKTELLPPAANSTVSSMLSGRAAGLTVIQNSAQPGGATNLQIRGSATGRSPLIVIDGVAQSSFGAIGSSYIGSVGDVESNLLSINPNDVESIEVLKDASATSIYGSRAAGGVILITTKHGKEGKVTVSYKGSATVQQMYGLPEMLDNVSFMKEANESIKENWMRNNGVYPYGTLSYEQAMNDGRTIWSPLFSDSDISNVGKGTDWLKEITRTGFVHEHNLSVNGGTEKTKYDLSLGYYDQKGIVKNNDLDKFTMRLSLDQKFNDWIKGGVITSISSTNMDVVPLGNGANENSGIIRAAIAFPSCIPVKNEDGSYSTNPWATYNLNPVSLLEITDKSRTEKLLMSSYVQVNPFEGFNIRAQFSADRMQGRRNYYLPTTVVFGAREGGYASLAAKEETDYTMNFVANYMKTIGNHSITVMAGYEYQKFVWDNESMYNSDFPYDGVLWYNMAAGAREKPGVGSSGGNANMKSIISRLTYSYGDRYLLTANFRADGSSNFAPNHKWGYFPGVSLAWKIHNEKFMSSTSNWLSELKLRAGYGQTGNDRISGIDTYYSTGWDYILGGKKINGIYLSTLGNPDLKWETQTDFNIGLDFGLFNQRITGTFEYFNRVVSDILGSKYLMSYQEVNSIASNLGSEKLTNGFEATIHSNNISKRDFSWSTDLTFTYYRDRWNKRDDTWKPDIYSNYKAIFNELWYYESDGIVSIEDTDYIKQFGAIPGTIKIKDLNGYLVDDSGNRILDENGKPQYSGSPDGKIDNADLVLKGINTPFTVGFNNYFAYKGFDLNIYFYGMFNRWQTNQTKNYYIVSSYLVREGNNMYKECADRWSYDNMDSTIPSIFQVNSNYGTGDYFLENSWFIRCRNITLGYSLPQRLLGKHLSGVRFYCDLQNPFVITPYSGSDPETDYMGAYFNTHSYTLGVNVKF